MTDCQRCGDPPAAVKCFDRACPSSAKASEAELAAYERTCERRLDPVTDEMVDRAAEALFGIPRRATSNEADLEQRRRWAREALNAATPTVTRRMTDLDRALAENARLRELIATAREYLFNDDRRAALVVLDGPLPPPRAGT